VEDWQKHFEKMEVALKEMRLVRSSAQDAYPRYADLYPVVVVGIQV